MSPLSEAIFLFVMILILVGEVVIVTDLAIGTWLLKRWGLYPLMRFSCMCGFSKTISQVPYHMYNAIVCRRHMKKCLVWLLRLEGYLTVYWAVEYSELYLANRLTSMDIELYERLSAKDRRKS